MYAELMAEHGGLFGPADEQLLSATLARPRNAHVYREPRPNLFELAAAYGFGFARNHCFPDGNKRIALAAIDVFLQMNGYELTADEPDVVTTIGGVASGEVSEEDLARWIERNSAAIE
jgi:death-on-curing protein